MTLHTPSRQPFKRGLSALCLMATLLCSLILLGLPTSAQEASKQADWIASLDLQDATVAAYIAPLTDAQAWPYTAPYLEIFAQLPAGEQQLIAQNQYANIEALPAPYQSLVRSLRLPPELRSDILARIETDHDLPTERIDRLLELVAQPRVSRAETKGFPTGEVTYLRVARLLDKLSAFGDLSMREFEVIQRSAPLEHQALPQVVGLRIAEVGADEARASAAEAEVRAAEAEVRAAEAEVRAAEAEVRAAEAEARADEQRRRTALARSVAEALDELTQELTQPD